MSFLSLSTDLVSQAYPDEPLAVSGDSTVGQVIQLMRTQRCSCVVVCDAAELSGIFTERDALRWMASAASPQASIREWMTPQPVTLTTKSSVGQTIEMMSEGGYRHLPIVDEQGQPSGVAAVRGIVHYLVDHFPQTIYNLPPEPGRRGADREGA